MFGRETLNFLLPARMTYATPSRCHHQSFGGGGEWREHRGCSVHEVAVQSGVPSLTLRIVAPCTLGSRGDVCVRTLLRAGHPICLRLKHTLGGNINSRLSAVTGYCVLQETFRRLNKKIQADALSAEDAGISTAGRGDATERRGRGEGAETSTSIDSFFRAAKQRKQRPTSSRSSTRWMQRNVPREELVTKCTTVETIICRIQIYGKFPSPRFRHEISFATD